ncbi:hypothetical protein MOQ_001348 [Trypanosoma cruzi marinkellei]|uniref:Uncharacterized protein n=1 Tax=Trypanosoma cruzi marinkellei TaxID=85056 RepID=K2NTX5_TRYCR|nr:hypothetical protein MOQ_001348 [Trypanosoma cruzi marinkellei]
MSIQRGAADDDGGALLRAVEERIPCEIRCHFTGMASYRQLRDGNEGESTFVSHPKKRFREFTCEKEVCVESCTSHVLSCTACQILKGYCVLWAESLVNVVTYEPFVSRAERRRRGDAKTQTTTTTKEIRGRHQLIFHTLHIVDEAAYKQPLQHSFALQSVCQPGRVLQLECYPYHMIHFGLLIYTLWRCPDEVFSAIRNMPRQKKVNTSPEKETCMTETEAMSLSPLHFPLLATTEDVSVLILGLGGNVIGNCLDAALPVDVPIEVVEVEPAVFETCQKHGQVPPCSEVRTNKENETTRVWVVRQGRQRHPNYRFIIGDARVVLQEDKTHQKTESESPLHNRCYGLVFLDCYDPEKERMMHDGSLIDVCQSRLCPGGVLIVNAHILPTREALEEQFLSRGFASVQVLRVAGCVQSIVVCLARDKASASIPKEEKSINGRGGRRQIERLDRFCVRHARHLASYIRYASRADPGMCRLFRNGFSLDANWLRSSRSVKGASCNTRVWEHYD